MKENAKEYLQAHWAYLDNLLGEGHTVAAPNTPEEANDPIWANPDFAYLILNRNRGGGEKRRGNKKTKTS
jgi:hypothetical protein